MLAIEEIIIQLSEAGVHVYLDGGKLKTRSFKNNMSSDLVSIIRSNKDRLIAHLASRNADSSNQGKKRPRIKPVLRDSNSFPLSFAQERLWFIDRMNEGSPEYNMPSNLPITGKFDVEAAEQAFTRIIQRHEPLRTVFVEGDEGPVQIIQENVTFKLTRHDLTSLNKEEQTIRADELVTQESLKVFDLSRDLMLRVTYLDLTGKDDKKNGMLLFTLHHIAADGWSMDIISKEFFAQYRAILTGRPDPLTPLGIQYVDYTCWQREWLQGEVLENQLVYWDKQLAEVPAVHSLPLDFARPEIKSQDGAGIREFIPKAFSQQLINLAKRYKVTPFMLLHGALGIVLSRHSNSDDIVIGTPAANRTQVELESLIGFFVNSLVLRINTEHENFSDYISHVKEVNLEAQANQDVPFENLVERLNIHRSIQHSPLFQIMFTMNTNEGAGSHLDSFEKHFTPDTLVKFDLLIGAQLNEDGGYLSWEYDKSIFSRERIESLNGHVQRLLRGIAEKPEAAIADYPMLSVEETNYLQFELNRRQLEYDKSKLIHELFEQQAIEFPESIAVIFGDQQLTYCQLNKQANQLAHYLVERGVKPDVLVGLCIERSLELVVAILAILKAGGAYVPLDPSYPLARLQAMLDDCGIVSLLSQSGLTDDLVLSQAVNVIELDHVLFSRELETYPTGNVDSRALGYSTAQLAYVIYTSGSTGKPKGVMQTHSTLSNLVHSCKALDGLPRNRRTLQFTSISFDVSIQELASSWLTASPLLLISQNEKDNLDRLPGLLKSQQVERVYLPPSVLQLIAELIQQEQVFLAHLKEIIVAGDVLNITPVINSFFERHPHCQLWNHYGPTETHVATTVLVDGQESNVQPSIGKPIGNTSLYVLDKSLQMVPFNSVGELYIGGAGVARGYLNLPGLTKKRFVKNPFIRESNSRLYRTGDLVRYLPDGNLTFIGRNDEQVKIRGFRIELGEIEHLLSQCGGVGSSLVLARDDEQGQKHLVAYVVPEDRKEKRENNSDSEFFSQLRQSLQCQLPDYMLPSAFVLIKEWPLTSNGKINKKALPAPDEALYQSEYEAPATKSERELVAIWARLLTLDADKISVTANFFELGGHSLLAVRLVAEIRTRLKQEITIKAVFGTPNIRDLSSLVDAGSNLALRRSINPVNRDGTNLALSFAQERLWFIDRMEGGSPEYNMPMTLPVTGEFNVDAAELAFDRIIQRHEPLRTVFAEGEEGPVQIIRENVSFKFSRHSLSDLDKEKKKLRVKALINLERQKVFDLSRDLMLRGTYIDFSDDGEQQQGVLLLTMHHIATDGWSMNILSKEFSIQYQAILKNRPDPLEPLKIQYADYAHWQREWLAAEVLQSQLVYWDKQLAEVPAVHSLPLDFARPDMKSHVGATVSESLPVELCQQLIELARQYEVTPFMLLHGALGLVLSRHSSSTDIVLGTPVANRMEVELEPLIGFFVNTLVLRVNTSHEKFDSYIEYVKTVNLEAQANQDVPFESLVERCQIPRSTQHSPLFQIMFSMNTYDNPNSSKVREYSAGVSYLQDTVAKFDLTVDAELTENGGYLSWEFDTSLFTQSHIEIFNAHLQRLLRGIVEMPGSLLQDLPMLSEEEIRDLTHELNDTQVDYPEDRLIHQLFEQQVKSIPEAVAVVFEDKQLTYKALNEKSNQLAHYLVNEKQVKPDTLVGICIERSLDMIVGILGILKAGGAYMPLDPAYPQNRLQYMLSDSGTEYLLSHSQLKKDLKFSREIDVIELDSETHLQWMENYPTTNINGQASGYTASQLAYVIYTSGSTGQPKGVMVENAHWNAYSNAIRSLYHLEPSDRVLQFSSVSFDIFIEELTTSILNGGCLVFLDDKKVPAAHDFWKFLGQKNISIVSIPTAYWHQLCSDPNLSVDTKNKALRLVIAGGEAMAASSLKYWQKSTNKELQLFNTYGPTESTVITSSFDVTEYQIGTGSVPIGKALTNSAMLVLNQRMQLVPYGSLGELYIAGSSVARGYINYPEITARRFIQNLYSNDQDDRLYRTGDIVRYLPDGNIEFIGRADEQVKIRGFRIEPNEIEYPLSQCKGVGSALVLVKEDGAGQKSLVAYVIPEEKTTGESGLVSQLRQDLSTSLPDYMIPSAFVILRRWPLTPNGKIDRKSLPAPSWTLLQGDYKAPKTETEKGLVSIWAKLLKLGAEAISVTANFFEMGGHSLLAVRLVAEIRAQFAQEIAIKTIFEFPNIRGLSSLIDVGSKLALRRSITPLNRDGVKLTLSFAQERLWFIDRMEGGSPEYNMPLVLPVTSDFNVDVAEQAFDRIVQRHEPLRTVFAETEEGPVQIIQDNVSFSLVRHRLSGLDKEKQKVHAKELISQERKKVFDLSSDLMLRGTYLDLSGDGEKQQGVLLLTMHHIASDGWSMDILSKEFSIQYQAILKNKPDPLEPLKIQYADYAHWQRQWLSGEVLQKQLTYWDKQLAAVPAVHSLPLDFARPDMKSHVGAVVSESLPEELSQKLIKLARLFEITPFMLLHGALGLVLSRHSRCTDIVIGTPVANRMQVELEPLIGFFVNTLILRTNTDYEKFSDYILHVKTVNLDAQANQDVPFEKLVERCQIPRSIQHSPLFQIMFRMNINESGADERIRGGVRDDTPGVHFSINAVAKFDLMIDAELTENGGNLSWVYDTSIFTQTHIENFNVHLQRLLWGITEKPESLTHDLPMLSDEEIHYLTYELNNTEKDYPKDRLIHHLFEQQVENNSEAVAVVFEGKQQTYQTLNEKSNQLAHFLVNEKRVNPDTLVGICLDRSLEMIVGILGILKAGGAYVPLDPDYPEARLAYMLADAKLATVISQTHLKERLPASEQQILCLDDNRVLETLTQQSTSNINPQYFGLQSKHLAYVIYTSGSTGNPKGVMVQHRSVVNLSCNIRQLDLTAGHSQWGWLAPFVFDASIKGLTQLVMGHPLHVIKTQVKQDFSNLIPILDSLGVIDCTPAMVEAWFALGIESQLPNLVIGGEAISPELWNLLVDWQAKYNKKAINVYGPTECTVNASGCVISGDRPHIGKVFPNVKGYVLNAGRLCGQGIIGEYHISGAGLARGYLNNPALTAEKFITNPFYEEGNPDSNKRLYRTGDLVRYLPDGNLAFIGRIDDQVKIRGFRIELGEIEYQLSRCKGIGSALVLAREDGTGQKSLMAYVIPKNKESDDSELVVQLKQEIQAHLPDYMVPSAFVLLKEWPLTPNGKIDRKALPAPDGTLCSGEYEAPITETEHELVAIWAKLLKLDAEVISVTANFFELGGHSLLAVRLVAEIRARFEQEIAIKTIFEFPDIRNQSSLIETDFRLALRRSVTPVNRDGDNLELSFAQERLWFIDRMEGGSPEYNMPLTLPITGKFNIDVAEQALGRIIQRHEPLRTVFAETEGEPFQVIRENVAFKLERYSLSGLDKEKLQARVNELINGESQKAFDLSSDLMLRGTYLNLSGDGKKQQGVLLLTMHHIASDGWSMDILSREFSIQYQAILECKPDPLEPLNIQYADYAHWQREWLVGEVLQSQLTYWDRQLAEVPAVHSLPLDFARPAMKSHVGAVISEPLPAELCQQIISLSRQYEVTPFMLLHGALGLILSWHSSKTDIVVGTPVANRMQVELEPLIGFFVNTLVLRIRTDHEKFSEYIEHVKAINLEAQANQDVPFERLVERCQVLRSTQYSPLFQIMFSMNTNERSGRNKAGVYTPGVHFSAGTVAKFDLTISAELTESGGYLSWEYDTSLFSQTHIETFNAHLQRLLKGIVDTPESLVRDLPMLSDKEIHYLTHELNNTEIDYPKDLLIHQLFEQQVRNSPEAVAIVFGDKQLTYQGLNMKSNQLACFLIKEKQVKADTLVGICMERSLEMIVGILAILKSGGAYVPLDPDYPEARLLYMLKDTDLATIITETQLKERLPVIAQHSLCLDDKTVLEELARQPDTNVNPKGLGLQPKHLAYVNYTSGSTGKPKGVLVTHQNVVGLVSDKVYILIDRDDVIVHAANIAFDAATFEIWGGLCNGARVLQINKDSLLAATQLEARLKSNSVSIMFVTTALFNQVAYARPSCFAGLRYLLFGGEQVNYDAVQVILEKKEKTQLLHVYGPTEATTFSTYAAINQHYQNDAKIIPIGKPLQNGKTYILDQQRKMVPIGSIGELYIGGCGIARGYLNQPELNEECFIQNPFSGVASDRLYKTGDLVRYVPDGHIAFIGRIDDQVKIRGFRIELGEIENQLSQNKNVASCLVLAPQDEQAQKRLVAYVIPENYESPVAGDLVDTKLADTELATLLRQDLQVHLPDYMVPSAFVLLKEWPLTPNGKIDRQALPEPDGSLLQGDYEAPITKTEKELTAIWGKLLKLNFDTISVTANFFELGGHSLLAVRLVAEIRSRIEQEIAIKAIFKFPNIRSLSLHVDAGSNLALRRAVVPVNRDGNKLVLSFAQERLWFIDRMEGGSPEYNIPISLPITGEFNVDVAEQAVSRIIQRHEPLRTVFAETENGPVQIIREDVPFKLARYDLAGLNEESQVERVKEIGSQEKQKVFDLRSDLMLRGAYLEIANNGKKQQGILLLTMHHIASDGWSMEILSKEFSTQYQAILNNKPDPMEPLKIQYADYAYWQREWLSGEVLQNQLSYWDKQLAEVPAVHSLPLDFARPAMKSHVGAVVSESLPGELSRRLIKLARQYAVTPFMLLHGALGLVFSRHSNSQDIVIGTPLANRMQVELEPLIGFFVNTLVLRTRTNHVKFDDYIKHVKTVNLEAQANQDVPFERLVERCQVPRSIQHSPLFQIMFSMNTNKSGGDGRGKVRSSGVHFSTNAVAKFDLTFNAELTKSGGYFSWVYDTSLFSQYHIETFNAHLQRLLKAIIEMPKPLLRDLPLLSDREIHFLTHELNRSQMDYSEDRLIHQLFEQQVETNPEAVAVVHKGRQLTYQELNKESNRLAHYLVKERQVKPDTLIGICVERSLEMIVGILGVLKAGGAYVPLDPDYPDARLAYMIKDAALETMLTQSQLLSKIPFNQAQVLCLDADYLQKTLEPYSADNLDPLAIGLRNSHLAYVIYTSGSTGHPKGVMIEHNNTIGLIAWGAAHFRFDDLESVLASTSICFDLSVFEIFVPLGMGGRIVLVDSILTIGEESAEEEVTLINTVPSAIQGILETNSLPESVKAINLAGEVLKQDLVEQLVKKGIENIFDLYGPSEDTTYSTCSLRIKGGKNTIGKPLANKQTYVLADDLQILPVGVVGELYIGGVGLARGYLNRPELTAEKFIQNPFSDNRKDRLYKTGDFVRYLPDGNLVFIGRIDDQVKIRGFRIELGEIEARLSEFECVASCLVLIRENEPGQKILVAYVVAKAIKGLDNAIKQDKLVVELRENLSKSLPDYMLPSAFVILDEFPLTPNGKVDKKALPAPDGTLYQGEYVAPENETERTLTAIWARLLKLDFNTISVTANFFELGGHSLLAVRLVAEIRSRIDQEIAIKTIFEFPNIRSLSLQVDAGSNLALRRAVTPVNRDGNKLVLSFAQERLWFIDRMEGGSPEYNMPITLPIAGDFNVDAAEQAFKRIIQRHEPLRTIFAEREEGTVQIIRNDFSFELSRHSLGGLDKEEQKARVKELVIRERQKVFDLSSDLMLRGTYLDLSGDEEKQQTVKKQQGVLLLTMHHIASDGWSMDILSKEFSIQYQAILNNKPDPLEPLTIQYADYAQWQREWLAGEVLQSQLNYWDKQLAEVPAVHSLALDFVRPAMKKHVGAIISESLPLELSQQLINLSRQYGITSFMLLHGALGIVLSRHSSSADIVIGTPVANRMQVELEPLIGFFVNTLVLRTNTNHEKFSDYIEHVKTVNLEAQANQDVPFERLVERCQIPRNIQHSPLFQIMFSMNTNESSGRRSAKEHTPGIHFSTNAVAKFDLTIDAELTENGGYLSWEYDTALFSRSHIETFNDQLRRLLRGIVEKTDPLLRDLPMLSEKEIQHLTYEINDSQTDYPSDRLIHQMFEQQVVKSPEAIAIVFGDQQLTYQALNEESNRLAHYLVNEGQVKPDTLVGICIERSLDMIIGILAILKAGGAYVPFDPAYPESRLQYMLTDSGTKCLLSQSGLLNGLTFSQGIIVIELDSESHLQRKKTYPTSNVDGYTPGYSASQLAYVIYTSGSTGQPKGVMVEHGSVSQHIQAVVDHYLLDSQDSVLQFASISFDTFVEQTFAALVSGASLHLRGNTLWNIREFYHNAQKYQITVTDLSPTYLAELLNDAVGELFWQSSPIKQIVVGGEALQPSIVKKWHQLDTKTCRLFNAYGPTEATITSSLSEIKSDKKVSIGHSFAGRKLYILDNNRQLAPYGAAGELYIGGESVARGYLNRPGQTRQKFIASPFNDCERLYKTGDLVRYLPNGELSFISRVDDQVKIRGFRIEPGEIEYQLSQCKGVSSNVVIAREDEPGQKCLVAYVIPEEPIGEPLDKESMISIYKAHLNAQFPAYMLPSVYIFLKEFPLTPNGKVNRNKLPKPESSNFQTTPYLAPRNNIELWLCEMWQDLFGLERVGINDNFFELGGHSLLTVKLASKINKRFGLYVPIFSFFQNQTIGSFAKILVSQKNVNLANPLIKMNPGGKGMPIFMVPGMGGSSHIFYELSTVLAKEHPVFGLDAVGINGDTEPHGSIQEIAENNVTCLLKTSFKGPYILVGHSLGAAVAFEMAKLLELKTKQTPTLIIIDGSPYLDSSKKIKFPKNMHASNMQQGFVNILEKQANISYTPNDVTVENVIVIQAQENERQLKREWQKYSRNTLEYHCISGDHFSILRKPSASTVARIINISAEN